MIIIDFGEIIKIFSYPFAIRALIVGALISICAALLGNLLVLKRYSLIGHSLADVSFASISLTLVLGVSPMLFSIPIVIACSFLIMYLSQSKKIHGDISIGIFSTGSLAVGVLISSLNQGFNADVYGYMFGSILSIDFFDVIISVILSILILGLFFVFYNRLFLITADETFAKASGFNINFYHFLISFMTSLIIVVGMKIMGTLLISSLIIFPAVTAKKCAKSFKFLVIFSGIISFICFLFGMIFSFLFNVPTGASIVFSNIIIMALVFLKRKFI